jgi:hypothetical protein
MSVMDDVLQGKDPERQVAEFCLKAELREQWSKAKGKEAMARIQAEARPKDQAASAELEAATAELDELRECIQGAMLRFVMHPVDRQTFDRLKSENRPTETQRREAKTQGLQPPDWNTATFAPALVAASCVELTGPSGTQDGLSTEDAVAIWSSPRWNEAERNELFNTCLAAYLSRTPMDGASLGNG